MRVRLTFHNGDVTTYDAPEGVNVLLANLANRTGYDLLPCLSKPPEVLDDEASVPVALPVVAAIDAPVAEIVPLTTEVSNEGSQPAQVPGNDGETVQQHGDGGPDVAAAAGSGAGDQASETPKGADAGSTGSADVADHGGETQ